MKQEEYSIEDLAKRSGLTVRTVRYYMQQGLVPAPDTAGKYASYSERHLDHLKMVNRLKGLHLPLKEIRQIVASMTTTDMRKMLAMQERLSLQDLHFDREETEASNGELSSAMDYIEGLARRQARVKRIAEQPMLYSQPTMGEAQGARPEQWSKIRLAEGIELQVREQEARALRKEIEALIEAARRILGKRDGA